MDQPNIIYPGKKSDQIKLSSLRAKKVIEKDFVMGQVEELFKIKYPKKSHDSDSIKKYQNSYPLKNTVWVYYPWHNQLVHILNEQDYYVLRTARNYPLIPRVTQQKLHKLDIAVAGLSVGSNIVRALVYAGIGRSFRLADSDILATSNLNRITSNLLDLGSNKTEILARQIWEIDPFIQIELYSEGLTANNLVNYLCSRPRPNLIFDEVDDFTLKFYLRVASKTLRLAYLMVTDNGFSAELDVLRFDKHEKIAGIGELPPVTMSDITAALSSNEKIILTPLEEQELINSLIDSKDRSPEMKLAGTLKFQQKIIGWPQLQATASVGGSMAVSALIEYVSGHLISGKKMISLK